MKASTRAQAAVSMAIIASIATAGLARGFNIASNVYRSRGLQTIPLHFRGGSSSAANNNRSFSLASQCASETTMERTDDDALNEIEEAARSCMPLHRSLAITGSLPPPKSFGGIPYLDTTSLSEKHSHRVIFVLGGPGAGKGTQSERIVDTYKCVHLSVGELLRSGAEKEGYEHADLVKECLVKGNIVPVEVSLGLLRIAMDEKANESSADGEEGYGSRIFLVDGFPRNFDNVNGWMKHMPSYTAVLGALVYNCPMEILEKRIMGRAETSGRSDDNLESARRRFNTFQRETEPVVKALERAEQLQADEFGGSQLKVVNIDGTGTVEEVWGLTESAMDSFARNDILTANAHLLQEEDTSVDDISNAQVDIKNGVEAVVSYDRKVGDDTVKECRTWKHGPGGWTCMKDQ